jgi:putative nucleotidyltransferase with HDIG domain
MTAHQLVAKARNLPQISEAALKLIEMLGHPETDAKEIVHQLTTDSLLTAKLLRACNSPAMGLQEKVTSVHQAVILLGYDQIHSLVLSLAFGAALAVPLPSYAMKANDLRRHALKVGAAAEALIRAGVVSEGEPAMAFTIGLLHDIGKLLMVQSLPPEAHLAINQHINAEGLGTIEAEREVLGTDHAEVGSCLLYLWRLPDVIVEAVANHHRPVPGAYGRLSGIAHLANRLAHLADGQTEGYAFQPQEAMVQAYEFPPEEQARLVQAVQASETRVRGLMAVA